MLTKLTIRNFKRFREVEIELGGTVVMIGPNNSGKTTALQALALWDLGLRRWNEKRAGFTAPEKRSGVSINRRDLIAVPIPDANLLFRDLHVREVQRTNGKQDTKHIRVDILVEGVSNDREWICGLEFDYANAESLYCRPLRKSEGKTPERYELPAEAGAVHVAYLPPMSGLTANETRLDEGAINVRVGEGRTAEVLRNLCYRVHTNQVRWRTLKERIDKLFGIEIDAPQYVSQRGEIAMSYTTRSKTRLDLSSAGRGLHQTLLLLAYLEEHPNSVLLLDEPDAHLEILRQRQIYQVLSEAAAEKSCQLIMASHSEVVLNEAAGRDVVVAFVGKPHRIDDRGAQVLKSLREIGFEDYYQAELTGWVLYLEGSTDLAILRAFAKALDHQAQIPLEKPFVHYIENQPHHARSHFRGLLEAKRDLVGFTLCDHLEKSLEPTKEHLEYMWKRREIENYLCQPETLISYAEADPSGFYPPGPLFAVERVEKMSESIRRHVTPAALENPKDPWWSRMKASDDFLDVVFESYLRSAGLPGSLVKKSDYHVLAAFVSVDAIDPEIRYVLDQIVDVSDRAVPAEDP